MKSVFLTLLALLLAGCASSGVQIKTSVANPIFIQAQQDATIYVDFKNTATNENVTNDILLEFTKQGYKIATDAKHADYIVLGDIISFARDVRKKRDVAFINMGFGRGYYPRYFSQIGFGYMLDADDFYTNSYAYTLTATLSISQRQKDEQKTSITITQQGNTYSTSTIWPLFKERLVKQIVSFFYRVK